MKQQAKNLAAAMGAATWAGMLGLALAIGLAACSAQPPAAVTPAPQVAATPTAAAAVTPETAAPTESEDQATVIVQLDDVRARVRSVEVTGPISGLALLQQSGLEVVTVDASWGSAVCSIAGVGCPVDDCFCGGDTFWNYGYWSDVGWRSYAVGSSQSLITATGAIEGWRWGTFEGTMVAPARLLAAQAAQNYLSAQQVITDGSSGGNVNSSVETLLALASNGVDASTPQASPTAPSLLGYVLANAAEYGQGGVAAAGKLAVGLAGTGACWPAEVNTPAAYFAPTSSYAPVDAGPVAWGVLGMAALDEPGVDEVAATLTGLALPTGGWEWSPGWGADTNATALAIQALIATGTPVSATEVVSGLAYLRSVQTPSGGFPYAAGGDPDANSTAYVIQALAAAGEDPGGEAWQQPEGTPFDYLMALQGADGGIAWQAGQPSNLAATQQAVPALLGQPYPVQRGALPVCEAQP